MTFSIKHKSGFKEQCLSKTSKGRKKNASLVSIKKAAGGGLPNDLAPSLEITLRDTGKLTASKRRVRKTDAEQVARVVTQIKPSVSSSRLPFAET